MTKKNYQKLAELVGKLKRQADISEVDNIELNKFEGELISYLQNDNPQFDLTKWQRRIAEMRENY